LQQIAQAKDFPLLVAAEMTTTWRGELTDLLCYGFDPNQGALSELARDVMQRQQANTREVYDHLLRQGLVFPPEAEAELTEILAAPSARQPPDLVAMVKKYSEAVTGKMLLEAGLSFVSSDPAAVVEAVHQGGGVCLIAHPGRTDGYNTFDVELLDQFRQAIPIDGFEVYHPDHTPEQIAMYRDYAQKHDLLTSSGSDSHGSDGQLPIKYPAELSRKLLERLGIEVG
ncbi:MAG: PHP domain-containing protein, partial [Anaerolineae bacterium]|nr:PHP domain-containing protein [Anaerolineae bacterium]